MPNNIRNSCPWWAPLFPQLFPYCRPIEILPPPPRPPLRPPGPPPPPPWSGQRPPVPPFALRGPDAKE